MEMSVVLKNLKTGVVENVNLEDFDDWDELEEKLGDGLDIDNNFRVTQADANLDEVQEALYKVYSLKELEWLVERLNHVDEETLGAFLELWNLETSLSLLESGDYQLYLAHDDEELGRELCNEGYFEVPEELEGYIDYEAMGNDYSMSVDGGFTSLGFVEAF